MFKKEYVYAESAFAAVKKYVSVYKDVPSDSVHVVESVGLNSGAKIELVERMTQKLNALRVSLNSLREVGIGDD